MLLYAIPPLDSIYWSPGFHQLNDNSRVPDGLVESIIWVPQILWALLSAWLLFRSTINCVGWMRLCRVLIAYSMVLGIVVLSWRAHHVELGPVVRTRDDNTKYYTSQVGKRAAFEEMTYPSLWALPLLLCVHLLALVSKSKEWN